jgi:hypothetical protein
MRTLHQRRKDQEKLWRREPWPAVACLSPPAFKRQFGNLRRVRGQVRNAITNQESNPMDKLISQYPTIIALMDREFTSHEFILALAQRNQPAYVAALHHYVAGGDPFRTLHGQLSQALRDFPTLVQHDGEVDSIDIFRNPGRCAKWRRL